MEGDLLDGMLDVPDDDGVMGCLDAHEIGFDHARELLLASQTVGEGEIKGRQSKRVRFRQITTVLLDEIQTHVDCLCVCVC